MRLFLFVDPQGTDKGQVMIYNYQSNANKPGIYKITNTHTGRIYIGQASRIKTRWVDHAASLNGNKHQNKFLQNDFNKCKEELGHDNFLVFDVVEVMEGSTKKERNDREELEIAKYFDKCKECYNIKEKVTGLDRACFSKTPEETKQKLSQALKKLWNDEEYKNKSLKKLHEGKLEALKDPEFRKQLGASISKTKKEKAEITSEQAKQRWADPAMREKVVEAIKEVLSTEESKQRKRAAYQKVKERREADPEALAEYKRKCSEHSKKIWEQGLIKDTEESRKNKSEAAKKRCAQGKSEHLKANSFKNKFVFNVRTPEGNIISFVDTKEKAEELGLNLGSFRSLCYGLIPALKGYVLQSRQEIQNN